VRDKYLTAGKAKAAEEEAAPVVEKIDTTSLNPPKKGGRHKLKRRGKNYNVIVTNVDEKNEKVTLRDTVSNKEHTTSLDTFNKYRLAFYNNNIETIFSKVKKFENGSRADRHNNPGAIVWSSKLQKQYPEMEKGDSFKDKGGTTRYTAKFPDKETGDRINKTIMFKMFVEANGDTSAFYSRWSGLPEESETVKNFVISTRKQ
jgi:hypothetical protein